MHKKLEESVFNIENRVELVSSLQANLKDNRLPQLMMGLELQCLVDRFTLLVEAAKGMSAKNHLQREVCRIFIEALPSDLSQNQSLMISISEMISTESLGAYLTKCGLELDCISGVEIRVNQFMFNGKWSDACNLICLFGYRLDVLSLVDRLIAGEGVSTIHRICQSVPGIVPEVVHRLCKNKKNRKLCVTLISEFGLDKELYPTVTEDFRREKVQKLYFPVLGEYHRAEERLQGYPFMLLYVVERLMEANMVDEALSIVKRNPQLGPIDRTYNYIENPLFINDHFGTQ